MSADYTYDPSVEAIESEDFHTSASAGLGDDNYGVDPDQLSLPGFDGEPEEDELIEPVEPHLESEIDDDGFDPEGDPEMDEAFDPALAMVAPEPESDEDFSPTISAEMQEAAGTDEDEEEIDEAIEEAHDVEPIVQVDESAEDLSTETAEPVEPEAVVAGAVRNVKASEPAAEPVPTEEPASEHKVADAETVSAEDASPAEEDARPIPATAVEEAVEPTGFAALPLRDQVLETVAELGYDQPTEIQERIIPHVLNGRDVLAQSQTGTGKTAAFALPILSMVELSRGKPQVLVLAPTRELAQQVAASFEKYGRNMRGLRTACIYGGSEYGSQFRDLKRMPQVVVGTPGRVIDHVNKKSLDLSEVECLVLDEADEMLNMGFLEDVQFVLERIPDERQIALFSATLPPPIRGISQHYLNDPARITVKSKTMTVEAIRQRAIFTPDREKLQVLQRILEAEETEGVIVFVKTKEGTVDAAEKLARTGLSAVAINGDMPQKVRERTIRQFKKGHIDILVATDVAARGLDVERVSHVFNFDLPHGTESYVHRIGRTGRAGRKGEAIIFLTYGQKGKLRQIERVTRQQIEVVEPPTADEINKIRVQRYKQKITRTAAESDLAFFREMLVAHAEETGLPMDLIAASVAQMGLGRKSFFLKKDKPKKKFEKSERGQKRDRRDRDGEQGGRQDRKHKHDRKVPEPDAGLARYRIAIGWRDGVKPGNIVGAIANEGGIEGKFIGHINIQNSFTTIDLPEDMPDDVRQHLYHTRVVGRQMRLELESERSGGKRHDRKGGHGQKNGGYGNRKSSYGDQNRAESGSDDKPYSKHKPGGKKFKKKPRFRK